MSTSRCAHGNVLPLYHRRGPLTAQKRARPPSALLAGGCRAALRAALPAARHAVYNPRVHVHGRTIRLPPQIVNHSHTLNNGGAMQRMLSFLAGVFSGLLVGAVGALL